MSSYPYLFSPLKLGSVTIKNRVIFGPHVTGHWSGEFLATPRAKAYYDERARGGVGLIIVGAASVDETADYFPFTQPGLFKEEVVPGFREIADSVHSYGTKIVQQIVHPGVHQIPERDSSHPGRAPSQIPAIEEPSYIPKELEPEEILEIEGKFAVAAERVKRAGFDGVEVHVAHGYLPWAFLTPLKNKRVDQYGGSLANRFRFTREILEKVRAAVGRDQIVGTRISSSDMYPGGLDVDDVVQIAKLIEATGLVDYISVSMGTYRSIQTMIPTHYAGFEPGYQSEFTKKIKAAVSLPVFVVGRINDPALGERIISNGDADAVVMVRELIAEPHFASKAAEGRVNEIRPCMYCNQKCLAHIFIPAAHVECNANPVTGEEYVWAGDKLAPRVSPKAKVLIIGGGPGGLECARIAARRGCDVALYEKAATVGGQMQLMCKLPGRSEPHNFLDWLEREARREGAVLKCGMEITAANVDEVLRSESPDAVVVATGGRAAQDGRSGLTTEPMPGSERSNVFSYTQIISGERKVLGEKVLIVDELGDRVAPGLAEMLAKDGRKVEIITRWLNVSHMWSVYWNEISWLYGMLDELGVVVIPNSWVKEIGAAGATCFNIYSGREWQVAADSIVLSTMRYSNNDLYHLLKQKGVQPLYLVGDAKAPRQIGEAVRDGHAVAREIGKARISDRAHAA